jgi:hypothetical protein
MISSASALRFSCARERCVNAPRYSTGRTPLLAFGSSHCLVPLTGTQLRMWRRFREQGSFLSARTTATAVRVDGTIDLQVLRETIQEVIRRHESLRTRFEGLDDVPRQVVDPPGSYDLDVTDLTASKPEHLDSEVRRLVAEFIREKVDLSRGPLFAARVFKLSSRDHIVVCSLDHMISDGTSLRILDEELWALYELRLRRQASTLPELPIQFGDYAVWEERTRERRLKACEAYWRRRLADAPRVRFPGSIGIRIQRDRTGALLQLSLGQELSRGLRKLVERERAMLPLLGLTLYVAVASAWCERDEVVVVLLTASRYNPEVQRMIGCLSSFLHLRLRVERADTFRGLLRRVTTEFYSAIRHDTLDQLPALLPEWEGGQVDLYFNWLSLPDRRRELPDVNGMGQASLQHFEVRLPEPIGFLPIFHESGGEVGVTVYHISDVYPESVVRRWWQNYCSFAERFVREPGAQIPRFQ